MPRVQVSDGGVFLDEYGTLRVGWIFAAVLSAILALVAGIIVIVNHYVEAYDRGMCPKIGAQMDRQVKFVRYNYWSWDCLTPDDNGHWIPTDKLRVVSNG